MHGCETTHGCRTCSGFNSFCIIVAGFTKVGMQIDQARKHDLAGGINRMFGLDCEVLSQFGNGAVGVNGDVGGDPVGSRATGNHMRNRHSLAFHCPSCPANSRYSTAIRTDTPLATCSSAVFCAESAAAAEISRPRFIGPGCMINVGVFAMVLYRSFVSPQPRVYSAAEGKKSPDIRSACTRSIMTASGRWASIASRS